MFKGRKHSPETIRRMSLAQKQRYKKFPFRPETGALLRAANLGRKCSPETCRSMSESRIRFRLPLDELKKRYMNGETTVSLASFYGCSNDIIAKNLRDAGVKIRNQSEANVLRYKKNLPEIEILRRYNSGESVNQIARTFSVTRHAINKLLSEQHVPIRSLDEARIVATGNGVMRQAALNRWARVRSAT
jgi:predicted metal-binding transcription factor (methanogenesis marker protein 9)